MNDNQTPHSCSFPHAHEQVSRTLARCRSVMLDPCTSAKTLGAAGEQYAAYSLIRQDWHLIASNWRTRYGEIDLIMLTDDRILVFVEVKTRRTTRFGTPEEAVHAAKQAALRKAGRLWLSEQQGNTPYYRGIRFDVVSIRVCGSDVDLRHLPGAF